MKQFPSRRLMIVALALAMTSVLSAQKKYSKSFIKKQKEAAAEMVEQRHKMSQVMVDKVFSFAEVGFHEVESSRYLTGILEEAGFEVTRGVSGIPTAWVARWSNGEGPVIALGSDVDDIPKASQYPGVAYHKSIIEGAPGHGEGHNSGIPLIITATISYVTILRFERQSIYTMRLAKRGELKHLSTPRSRKQRAIPSVAASESGIAQTARVSRAGL